MTDPVEWLPPSEVAALVKAELGNWMLSQADQQMIADTIHKVYGYFSVHMKDWQREEFTQLVWKELFE